MLRLLIPVALLLAFCLICLGSGQTISMAYVSYGTALRFLRMGQTQVAELRGRLGAFQKNTLEATRNSLGTTLENISAAEANIRETDFASETSNLTRSQILMASNVQTLRIAQQVPRSVLALLGQPLGS